MKELDRLQRACNRLARFRWIGQRGPRGGTIARSTESGTVLRGKAAQEALSRQPSEAQADAKPEAATPQAKQPDAPKDEGQRHEQASAKADGWLKKAAKFPKAAVNYVAGKMKALYAKMEAKYGSRWAKTIVATAIITFPTPVMTPSVLAMTGLAHLFTKLRAKTAATFAEGQAMAWDQIDKLAAALQRHLMTAFSGGAA